MFFSITVDAAQVKAWEQCASGRSGGQAVPGVQSAMVALTGERAGGAARRQPSPRAGEGRTESARRLRRARRRKPRAHGVAAGIPGVGAIIAVASGKGGVGKSTVAVNLALALRDLGLKVGVLDADIYGPSLPKLLAIKGRPQTIGGTRLKPMEGHGMKVMSIGFLVEEETPMIWRGPMVMSALTQMLREVEWGELDVMVVDMPPGTGDAQLTMAQQVPLRGAVIVSTPQDLALIDARRGIAMFRRVNVPVLGIVENMAISSARIAARAPTFSAMAARGTKPSGWACRSSARCRWHMEIREKSDAGAPVVASDPDGPHAEGFRAIAARVRDGLRAASRPAPKIVIEA